MRRMAIWLAVVMLMLATVTVGATEHGETPDVQHEIHTFRVATEQEKVYLVKGGSLNSSNIRFADGRAEIVYRFDIYNTVNVRRVELSGPIYQQLHLLVSTDGENYTEVYRWFGEVDDNGKGGLSRECRTFDLTPYLSIEGLNELYVKIADSYTSGGWGGAIHPSDDVTLDVSYIPATEQELNAEEMKVSAHVAPLFGCNAPWGDGFSLDTKERFAGYASLSATLRADRTEGSAVLDRAVDGRGMDTLELEIYLSDRAIVDLPFAGALEIAGGGQGARAVLSWDMKTVLSMIDDPAVGWNHVCLPLSLARMQGDGFDVGAVSAVRVYWDGFPALAERYTLKLDWLRLTDWQAVQREAVIASMRMLCDTVDELEKMSAQPLGEQTFKTFARLTETARRAYDGLSAAQRTVAADFDMAARIENAEQALAAYETAIADAPKPEDDAPPPVAIEPEEPAVVPDTPTEPDELPPENVPDDSEKAPSGTVHPMILVAVAVCVGGAILSAVLVVKKKKM